MSEAARFEALMAGRPKLEPGHVWLAGAGPGDAGHLTLDAVAGLSQTDAVVHDALVGRDVLDLANPAAERIFAGKRGGKPSMAQADITARLVDLARAGRRVLRLKGGDPFVFGRGGEEALTLAAAGIPFRIVSGITSGFAGLTAASIPPTMRGVNHAVILATGHGAGDEGGLDWRAMARLGQPIVLYMAMKTLHVIARELIAGGMPAATPTAVVVSATTPEERILVTTLGEAPRAVEAAKLEPPAIVAIGGIVAMRQRLADLAGAARERA